MKRQLDDYISRFYEPEAKRSAELKAHDFAKAREIVAWKENVASKWDQIEVLAVDYNESATNTYHTGGDFTIKCTLDTKGLGDSIGVELVTYKEHDGVSDFSGTKQLKVVSENGSIVTYELDEKLTDAATYRYALRMYPKNPMLPHRMDFAYVRWL